MLFCCYCWPSEKGTTEHLMTTYSWSLFPLWHAIVRTYTKKTLGGLPRATQSPREERRSSCFCGAPIFTFSGQGTSQTFFFQEWSFSRNKLGNQRVVHTFRFFSSKILMHPVKPTLLPLFPGNPVKPGGTLITSPPPPSPQSPSIFGGTCTTPGGLFSAPQAERFSQPLPDPKSLFKRVVKKKISIWPWSWSDKRLFLYSQCFT